MSILKIRAEIHTDLLIHKISWEVSGMIFYVYLIKKFCDLPLQIFLQNCNYHVCAIQ